MDLDDPRWGTILGIFGVVGLAAGFVLALIALPTANLQCFGIIVVIGVVLSFAVIFQRLRKAKHLTYQVVSNTLLLSVEEHVDIKGRVQVLLDNKPVGDVRLVILQIWNSGNLPIKLTDYEEKSITIDFGMLAEILDVEMVRKTHKNVNTPFSFKGCKLWLDPVSLSSQDTITMKVLLTRFNEEISVVARINGIESLKNWDKTAYVLMSKTGLFFYFAVVAAFILSFIAFYDITGIVENVLGIMQNQIIASWNLVGITAFSGVMTYITNLIIKIFKPEILPEYLKP